MTLATITIDVMLHPNLITEEVDGGEATTWIVVDPGIGGTALLALLESGSDAIRVTPGPALPLDELLTQLDPAAVQADLPAPDLHHALASVGPRAGAVFAGALPNARPLASRIAAITRSMDAAPAPARVCIVATGAGEAVAADAAYAAGMVTRLLLDEIEMPAVLTDAAGIAVALTGNYGSPHAALGASQRLRARSAQVGEEVAARELNAAAQLDVVGLVPILDSATGCLRPHVLPVS